MFHVHIFRPKERRQRPFTDLEEHIGLNAEDKKHARKENDKLNDQSEAKRLDKNKLAHQFIV